MVILIPKPATEHNYLRGVIYAHAYKHIHITHTHTHTHTYTHAAGSKCKRGRK